MSTCNSHHCALQGASGRTVSVGDTLGEHRTGRTRLDFSLQWVYFWSSADLLLLYTWVALSANAPPPRTKLVYLWSTIRLPLVCFRRVCVYGRVARVGYLHGDSRRHDTWGKLPKDREHRHSDGDDDLWDSYGDDMTRTNTSEVRRPGSSRLKTGPTSCVEDSIWTRKRWCSGLLFPSCCTCRCGHLVSSFQWSGLCDTQVCPGVVAKYTDGARLAEMRGRVERRLA